MPSRRKATPRRETISSCWTSMHSMRPTGRAWAYLDEKQGRIRDERGDLPRAGDGGMPGALGRGRAASPNPACYPEVDHARRLRSRSSPLVNAPPMTPNAAGSTFSMTSEAEHLLRLRKWLREELVGHGVPKKEQPNLL